MSNLAYPNRDWVQQQYGNRLAEIFDYMQQGINTVALKTGATPVGPTDPPPSISALNMSLTPDGHMQGVIQDSTPVKWGIHYFLEHSSTADFTQPHVIHLGQSRQWIGPNVSKSFPYWRAYSMYPGQSAQSSAVHHRGGIVSAPIIPSTGSGTASGNGQQGGQGFGTAPKRTPAVRNPGPPK